MVQRARARSWLAAAADAAELGELAESVRRLQSGLALRPHDPELLLALARAERRSGRLDEASKSLQQFMECGGGREVAALEQILAQVQSGDLRREPVLLAHLEQRHPDEPLILEALTLGYLQTFRLRSALDMSERWLEKQPDSLAAFMARGKTYMHMTLFAQGAESFRQAVERAPRHIGARLALAEALLEISRPAEAREHLEAAARADDAGPRVHLAMARALAAEGRSADALVHADAAVRLAPDDVDVLVTRGKLELTAERPHEAEKWLRRAAAVSFPSRELLYVMAETLEHTQKLAEAKEWRQKLQQFVAMQKELTILTAAIHQNPRDPAPRTKAGRLILEVGNEREAIRWLESALREDPDHFEAHRLLAEVFRKQGLTERAEFHQRRAAP
jgi:predicted Zn-dependent protease